MKKIIVVMPALNAAQTLEKTVQDIPRDLVSEIILVDDGSTDNTVDLARSLGLQVIVHSRNQGYGACQKSCYQEALRRGAEIVVMLHPDYQYDPRVIEPFVHFIELGICDFMLGSRVRTRKECLANGMPWWKYLSNRALTIVENLVLGQNLGDMHSGFRVMRRKVLETIPFLLNSNDFVFDSQFIAQAVYFGFKLGDGPVPVRYFKEASSINLVRSLNYGLLTLYTLFQFVISRFRIWPVKIFERRTGCRS